MVILGLSGAFNHDPAAALLVDGKLVAAAEEERFTREKHARNGMPVQATRFCLRHAGIKPHQVDAVAIPVAPAGFFTRSRWHYIRRYWYAPERSLEALLCDNRRYNRYIANLQQMLENAGIIPGQYQLVPVDHQLAHAASAYHLSGFEEKTAIMTLDNSGGHATTFFGYGEGRKIHKIKEFYDPDSLGRLYAVIAEYLGFDPLDGEYKVMQMSTLGDPDRYDFSRLLSFDGKNFEVNTKLANVVGLRRYRKRNQGCTFSPQLVEWLGPCRKGDLTDDPHCHYAAAMQKLYEDTTLQLMDHYLGDVLKESGKVAFAGTGALNVRLNQKIINRPDVKELFVQPASGDSGSAIGAAVYASEQQSQRVEPLIHVALGPDFDNDQIIEICEEHPEKPMFTRLDNTLEQTAQLLAEGHPVAWFQGRMEFGPRALGQRSILACPGIEGVVEKVNQQVKFRERWRPFCPSLLDRVAPQMFKGDHPSPFMTFVSEVTDEWKQRVPEIIDSDGTVRAQVVSREGSPRFYELLETVEEKTGNGVLLNTSLNRRGEPIACTPEDALNMFFGSDLQYLVMEDILVTKQP
ncbi:carbamoyltransferase family protein [Spongorhabdus nitratireducens]